MLRSLRFAPTLFVAALAFASIAGCQYGNGSPCELDSDCASGVCCGATARVRGVCRAVGDTCAVVTDTGVPEDANRDAPAVDTGVDGGAVDTGADAPVDTGIDAPVDTGRDAPESDTGTDSGEDAPLDA